MRSPTIKDVASLAGVSTATVSRVLSPPGAPVAANTRLRVHEAAGQLGYEPSAQPRNLRRRRLSVFGVVVTDIENPFYTSVVRACEREAERLGYRVLLVNTDENAHKEAGALKTLAAERVAGVILASTGLRNQEVAPLLRLGIPVVAIDNRVQGLDLDLVTVDNRTGARVAIEHLVALGHTQIAMICGPRAATSVFDRFLGYRDAMRSAGLRGLRDLVVESDLREAKAHDVTLALLERAEPPTAIFAVNNMTTVGVLKAARRLGVRMPDELSVVGFDDLTFAELFVPPLTVVAQPTQEIGRQAASLLESRLRFPEAPKQHVELAAQLVLRGSTSPRLTSAPEVAGRVPETERNWHREARRHQVEA